MDKSIVITRKLIADRIDDLLNKKVSARDFGDEMFWYIANVRDEYVYEEGYKGLLEETLSEFIDMHDIDKDDPGYKPRIPSKTKLLEIKQSLTT